MSTLQLSFVGFGLRLAIMFVVMLNVLLLARTLGPQRFGEYFLFIRVVSVLGALADLGVSQSANAFFGRYKEWRGSIHRIILGFVPIFWLVTAVLAGFILWLASEFLLPHLEKRLIVAAFVGLPLFLYANLWNSMMIGMGRIWRMNLVQVIMCTLSLGLTIVFVVVLKGGVMVAATCYLSVMLVQFVAMLAMALRISVDEASVKAPAELARRMLSFGLRGYLGSLSYLLWTRVPVFILNATYGAVAVGIFSLAQQMTEKIQLPVQAIQDVIYQKMSVLRGHLATLAMNRYLRLTWWGMIVLVVMAALLIPWAVTTLLGAAYASSIEVAQILLVGAAFIGVSQLLDVYFINQLHRPGLASILAWVSVVVGLTLAFLLIPRFGSRGAAWAVSCTNIFGSILCAGLYLYMTRTRVKELLSIRGKDVILVREQVLLMLKRS